MWIGSLEVSDERLIATDMGVIEARAVTAVMEENRFDAKMIRDAKGVPWKPSTRHKGMKIRTHIDEEEDDGHSHDEGSDEDLEE